MPSIYHTAEPWTKENNFDTKFVLIAFLHLLLLAKESTAKQASHDPKPTQAQLIQFRYFS